MIKNPLISVVLTSFNHKSYIQKALDAILCQSYSNIELIIVDDFSTDGSQIILNSYKNRYPSIQLHLLTKNTGSYVNSSNYGARLAKGDYINFAQCDDFSDPTQIEKLVLKAIEYPNAGVIYSRSNLIDSNGLVFTDDYENREFTFRKKCINDTFISGDLMFEFLSYSCVIPNLSSALIRRELFNSVGGLSVKYKVASDWALWLDLTFVTNFYYISEPLNYFRQHPSTIRNTIKFEYQVLELFDIFYSIAKIKKLNIKQRINLYVGSNIVWISGFISNPKVFRDTFIAIRKKTLNYNKVNLLYFCVCFFKVIKESLLKRLSFLVAKSD